MRVERRTTAGVYMIRFLQVNLNHCRAAQSLLDQTVVDRRIDVALVSEPHDRSTAGAPAWMTDQSGKAAAIGVFGEVAVAEIESGDGFVAARIGGINVFSCYASPNAQMASFRSLLARIEASVRRRGGDTVVVGDFNARSAAWSDWITDARGDELAAMADGLGLVVANEGGEPTFIGRGAGSVRDAGVRIPRTKAASVVSSQGGEYERPSIHSIRVRAREKLS